MVNKPTAKLNREKFYLKVRSTFFSGKLSQSQVDGMDHILNEWERRQLTDLRWLAYMLATVYHETAKTMQPVEEYGKGKGRKYGRPEANGKIYYGRGFVQITWGYNYKKFGIYSRPEMALDCTKATEILFDGMLKGMFTGKKLADYFNEDEKWINARRIINSLDKAEVIALYGKRFYSILQP
jgi:putative chitinase